MATLCEVVSYADLSGILPFSNGRILADNIGYVILHVVARTLQLLAFSTVTEMWLRTSIDADPRSLASSISTEVFLYHWLPPTFMLFTALLVVASVFLSVVIFERNPHAPTPESNLIIHLSMLQTILEAMVYGINLVMVMLSIDMTSRCIFILVPSWKRRFYLISKAVGPMVVSCLAYATRFGWLIIAYMDQDRRDSWAWWISFAWTPTIVVSIVLLYSVRKRDSAIDFEAIENNAIVDNDVVGCSDDNNNNNLQESLLRPQPPEEAFRAFHNFRRGDEDMNDSFSIGSPMPRRNLLEGDEDEFPTMEEISRSA
jgi:hypothetical protein